MAAGDDDEIRIHASLDGDLDDEVRRVTRSLENAESALDDLGDAGEEAGTKVEKGAAKAADSLDKAGRAGERAGKQISDGADDAASSLDEMNRRAEKTARQMSDMTREGAAAAASLDDVADNARKAGRESEAATAGAEALSKALGAAERAAKGAADSLDDAGDEAVQSGAKAAAASALWAKLTSTIDRHERISRKWASFQDGMRWSAWTARVERFSGAMGALGRLDWGGISKKADKVSKSFGGMTSVMMTMKFGGLIGAVYAVIGVLSALGAGAVGAAGGLLSLVPALGAVAGLAVVAKVGMKVFTSTMKEATAESEALKTQFEYASAVLDGGMRAGLQGFTKDSAQFAKVFRAGMGDMGASFEQVLKMAGAYTKLQSTQDRLAATFDMMAPIIAMLGAIALNVADSLHSAFLAVLPVVNIVAQDVQALSLSLQQNMRRWQESGAITTLVANSYDRLKYAIGIVVDFAKGLFRIFRIGAQESAWMATSIHDLAQRFNEWTASAQGQNAIRDYFQQAMPAVRETGLLIADLAKLFGKAATSQDMAPTINMIRTQLLPALADLAGTVGPGMVQFFSTLAQIFASLDFSPLGLLVDILNGVASAVLWLTQNVPGFGTFLTILMTIMAFMGPGAFIVAKLAMAFNILRTVMVNVQVAMALLKLLAPGMWAALTGPVAIVIAVVLAVVGVFTYLYTHCEWFRDAVDAVLRAVGGFFVWLWESAIKPAVGAIVTGFWAFVDGVVWLGQKIWEGLQAIGGFFADLWNGVLWPIISAIFTGLKWLAAIIFTIFVGPLILIFKGLAALFTWWWENITWPILQLVGDAFVWLWENAVRPALQAIGDFFVWIFQTLIQPVIDFFVGAWNGLGAALQFVWMVFIRPGLQAIGDFFGWIFNNVIMPVVNFFVDAWHGLGAALQFVWLTFIKPGLDAWGQLFRWIYDNVIAPVIQWVLDRWNDLGTGLRWVNDNIIRPVFDAISAGLGWVRDRFTDAVNGIRDIWNGLRNALAVPVNFLINTVWNEGILPAWNWVASKLGLPEGQKLNPIPEFAAGGAVRGAGTGTSDSIPAMLSNGEHVWTADEVKKAGGHDKIKKMREMAAAGTLRYFAGGGPVTPQEMHQVVAAALPGTRLTSGFRPGPAFHGTNRAADLAGPSSGDAGFMQRIDQFIGNNFGGSSELIHTPGPFNIKNGKAHTYSASIQRDHYDHVHWANNGSAPGQQGEGGGLLGSFFDMTAKPALDAILNPIIDGIPFHGPPEFMDTPKAMAVKSKENLYGWAKDKLNALEDFATGVADTIEKSLAIAQVKLVAAAYGWDTGAEWDAIVRLVQKESSWDTGAANPASSARGLFQKMTSLHGPVESTAAGQAMWGLNYIKGRYGTPTRAWAWHLAHNSYDQGGWLQPGVNVVENGMRGPEAVLTGPQWDMVGGLLDATAEMVAPGPTTGDGMAGELLDAITGLTTVIEERPPALAVSGDDTKQAVLAALAEDRRERAARGRYVYGGKG